MKLFQHFPFFRFLSVALVAVAFSGCSNLPASMRNLTYAPDFKYVSQDELRSDMQKLAYQLQQLDLALADAGKNQTSTQQQRVLEALRSMETIGAGLEAGNSGSNHPFLEDYMSNFVSAISQARSAAALDPPRYYLAGRVSGGCTNCHEVNR